ncbi:MarR family transcriptional regulator [Viridibacillus arvi]|nr:MarR family transcriptional regulator [Viridibacillus sp. JNUCC-6]
MPLKNNPTLFDLIHVLDKANENMILAWKKLFKVNIGISHILVLSYLKEHGKSKPTDIAKYLEFAPPSLTHLAEKLIHNHYCVRCQDTLDRRISYIQITPLGLEILEEASTLGAEMRQEYFKILSEDEIQELFSIYTKLTSQ